MRLYTLPILNAASPGGMTYPETRETASFGNAEIIKRVPAPDPLLVARLLAKPRFSVGAGSKPARKFWAGLERAGLEPAPTMNYGIRRLESPKLDTSVELEMPTSPAVLKIIYLNGNVSEYLSRTGKNAPPFLTAWLAAYNEWRQSVGESEISLNSLPWSDLTDELKQRLLDYASGRDYEYYARDRNVPGIFIASDAVPLFFNAPTKLFGREFPTGESVADLNAVLKPQVEFADPRTAARVREIELHLRHNASAGTVFRDAWTLLDGLGIPRVGQHVHVPSLAYGPFSKLYYGSSTQATRLAEFHSRINLIAEMIHIVMHRYPIWNGKFFGPLTAQKLADLTQRLCERNSRFGGAFKRAFVGFRGTDTYDSTDLYGAEYRAIIPEDDPDVIAAVLDAIQWSMHKEDYGISEERIRNWIQDFYPPALSSQDHENALVRRVAMTHYNHDWAAVFAHAPIEIRPRLDFRNRFLLRGLSHRKLELKMLLHDWGNHPLFFDDRQKQARILTAQRYALEKILAMQGLQTAVREFLIESGLYEWIPGSLGLKLPVEKKP